ncbi:Clan SB, family S8, subtilisin-like serine peptidase [Trichomonas vaginalis G3]|uniref:Clan SB, family S8, subtilisin-like serine peptidase n=1 Tax=Trichomonas vaginalis (strain ATCC PRA-98 / G3) TaxID=412133 RepID=A2DLL7_TRIV3|nr:proprotein convertase-related family [Trichomonas vaginalis G3]EAY18650.1 Clan SB, family S8, subtilisin-like serine peptidase [Trichomonas vaginalis G3]KAI5522535.1 proprotein convertase-related family [Trichomonas vaginalis G3]|eukprot:XP_001579636.1 Clan SB, family S8, subtilisin-like serine peptidase [Trichomonas vaginalis G3]
MNLNNRYATGFILSHENNLSYDSNDGYVVRRDLHELGIMGQDQVITIGDTGVDYLHPFFVDPNFDVSTLVNKTNKYHRKIIRIEAFSDYSDYANGHGTHVAGVALGEPYDSTAYSFQYKGVAPKAKLYMLDMGSANINRDLSAYLDYQVVLSNMKTFNSGIFSNSWSYNEYSQEITQNFDSMAYNNSDILFVFSAGNVYGPMTILSPGDTKNVLTVGMTSKPSVFHFEYPLYRKYYVSGGTEDRVFLIGTPNYSLPYFPTGEKLKTYRDIPITFDEPEEGKAYFSTDDPCTELQRAIDAKAAIFLYTSESCSRDKVQNIVCARVATSDADIIRTWTSLSICSDLLIEYDIFLHPYSSQGPCFNGIFKPDVAAPGYNILSARALSTSNGIDGLSEKTGTSMATPLVSGSAALVRQWFMQGKYPSIKKPSSYLIRAVIINSCIQLYPGNFRTPGSGYGVPFVSRGLGLEELSSRFFDNVTLDPGELHTYRISTTKKLNLSITMSYLDRPTANTFILFADIGIVLETTEGDFIYPNNRTNYAEECLSTNERILLQDADPGVYKLYVYANNYQDKYHERYALSILGGFSSTSSSAVRKISNEESAVICTSSKYNDKGRCECPDGTRGFLCREKVETIPYNISATKILPNMQYSWFSFTTDNNTDYSVYINDLTHGYFHACMCPTTEITYNCYCRMSTMEVRLGWFYADSSIKAYLAIAPIQQSPSLSRIFIGKDIDNTPTQRVTLTGNMTTTETLTADSNKSLSHATVAIVLIISILCVVIIVITILIIVLMFRKNKQKVEDKDQKESEEYDYEEDSDEKDEKKKNYKDKEEDSSRSVSIDVSYSSD